MPARAPHDPDPPQGNQQPPGNGGNSGNGDPPEPPQGPPPAQPGTDPNDLRNTAHNPTSEQEEQPPSEDTMRPGTTRLLTFLAFLALLCLIGYLLFTRGCTSPLAVVVPPVAPSASGSATAATPPTAPPSPYDLALATPDDFKSWCGGPAASKQFFVGDENGTNAPIVAFICVKGSEFVALPKDKANVLEGHNLMVAKGQKIESLFGNSMSYIGPDNKLGAQSAKAAHPLNVYLPGKTHVMVRVDGTLIDLVNPLVVITGDNGGDTFDALCAKYREMKNAPSEPWEAEIWSRCRRQKTASNVATTITIVKYVQANPGVSRDDYQTTTARIAKLEELVVANGNKPVTAQKVDTGVGK